MRTRPETAPAPVSTPANIDDGLADLLAFDPVPMARRSARGWTVARQRAFIAALAHYGVVSDAARAVGMSVRSAYALRLKPGAESFDIAWMCAQEEAMRDRKGEALDRALNGDPVSTLIGGEPARVRRDLSLGKQLRVFTALGREQVGRDARAKAAQDRQWHRDCAANRQALDQADREAAAQADEQRRAAEQWLDEAAQRRRASRGDGARVRLL